MDLRNEVGHLTERREAGDLPFVAIRLEAKQAGDLAIERPEALQLAE